jgi:hypothetical protein
MTHSRTTVALLLASLAVACGTPPAEGAAGSIVGAWSDGAATIVTFAGTDEEGTFSHVTTASTAGMPAGCGDAIRFSGTYVVRDFVLITTATAADVSRIGCDEPTYDVAPIAFPTAVDGFAPTFSGPITVTGSALTITLGCDVSFARVVPSAVPPE